ncbi:MAG TPA: ribonuclease III [Mollicutes bacterium]|jgi:ribonuclease-3 family protein|nr:ribonuclease III [Mollicutes bacterium]
MNVNEINALVLAYLGDAIYEIYIRKYLIQKGINKVNDLQKFAVNYVSAKSQASFLNYLIKNEILNEKELSIVKRARNAKVGSHPKRVDILTYKHATALEALIGYLYILNEEDRIKFIMDLITEEISNDSIW